MRALSILANGLASRGYDTSFVVTRGQHLPFFPLSQGVNIHVIGPDLGNFTLISGLLKKTQLALGCPSTDVAIANAFMTAYSVRFNQMMGRTKRALYFVQGYEPTAFGEYGHGPGWLKALKTRLAGLTYHLDLECVTNSTWTSKMIREYHNLNSVVAPLGVDTTIFHPVRSVKEKRAQSPVIMTVGNSNPVKRFNLFLDTVHRLRKKISCTALVVTHEQSLASPEDISAEFVSPDNDSQIAVLYDKASVFLSTSVCEGFGLPLLEAMACGTPVVTTDSGGIRDFCKDGFNCRIVQSASAEDLADAVAEIHSNKELESRLVQNGLATAHQWAWERLIDSFDTLLQFP